MKKWDDLLAKFSNPIYRLEKYLLRKGVITEDMNDKLRHDAKMSVRDSLKAASGLPKPDIDSLFDGVYDDTPYHIEEQRQELKAHLRKHPEPYNLSNFQNGEQWPKN